MTRRKACENASSGVNISRNVSTSGNRSGYPDEISSASGKPCLCKIDRKARTPSIDVASWLQHYSVGLQGRQSVRVDSSRMHRSIVPRI